MVPNSLRLVPRCYCLYRLQFKPFHLLLEGGAYAIRACWSCPFCTLMVMRSARSSHRLLSSNVSHPSSIPSTEEDLALPLKPLRSSFSFIGRARHPTTQSFRVCSNCSHTFCLFSSKPWHITTVGPCLFSPFPQNAPCLSLHLRRRGNVHCLLSL